MSTMAQQSKLTTGGQITVPAHVRKRWQTERVTVEDRGDHLVVRPLSEDRAARIAALRGIWKTGKSKDLVAAFERQREEDRELERRKERERGLIDE
jgi:bifunctional DNA-binding transcriptional regulator/antitoxin component of YhaV-PrlF toxin-antitoxin module